jgi:hypothetical protein
VPLTPHRGRCIFSWKEFDKGMVIWLAWNFRFELFPVKCVIGCIFEEEQGVCDSWYLL